MAFAKKKIVPEGQAPEEQETALKAMGSRLKAAREEAGMSRSQLAAKSSVPAKSLEKMEYGIMEPSASRMKKLCEVLNVSPNWLCGDADQDGDNDEDRGPRRTVKPVPANDQVEDEEADPLADAVELLEAMDELRDDGFDGARRTGNALLGDLLDALKRLEPGDMAVLAKKRKLFQGACPTEEDLWTIFDEKPTKAQEVCGRIDERLADTAVLGIDLYGLNLDGLISLARNLEEDHEGIDLPLFIGEGQRESLIRAVRPVLRALAFAGKAPDFSDTSEFPRRK